jgi:hypothetical protein
MAYPALDAPYGFKPVGVLGGRVYAGATRQVPIASGHATNIYYGDAVILSSNGCITTAALTATAVNILGVFQGCSYVNSLGQRVFSQYYPATISKTVDTSDATWAYVADDPFLVMKVAMVSGTTTITGLSRTNSVGGNVSMVYNAGSTITGNSKHAVLSTVDATTTTPVRIIDVVSESAGVVSGVTAGSFVEFLVIWNPNCHQYTSYVAAGV